MPTALAALVQEIQAAGPHPQQLASAVLERLLEA
jgi:hypothetical protein